MTCFIVQIMEMVIVILMERYLIVQIVEMVIWLKTLKGIGSKFFVQVTSDYLALDPFFIAAWRRTSSSWLRALNRDSSVEKFQHCIGAGEHFLHGFRAFYRWI